MTFIIKSFLVMDIEINQIYTDRVGNLKWMGGAFILSM